MTLDELEQDAIGGPGDYGRPRLLTFVRLRWIAIAGQTAAIAVTALYLDFPLPLRACLVAVAVSAWVNIFMMAVLPLNRVASVREAAAQLFFDTAQLLALLGLTGGVQNPFVVLVIAPVAIGAGALPWRWSFGLVGFACLGIAALTQFAGPLPWAPLGGLNLPMIYELGLAIAVIVGVLFSGFYAWRVSVDEGRLAKALETVQAILAREQRVSALCGLAAAAAHELGTPLATIHLVAKEMRAKALSDPEIKEDVELLVAQAERCRQILRQLASRPENGDQVFARMPLKAVLEEAVSPHLGLGRDIVVQAAPIGGGRAAQPELWRRPELLHALSGFVENAVGFAQNKVVVEGVWDARTIEIFVKDDGPGFSADIMLRLGQPYVSDRAEGAAQGGLGLGFFISKTMIERLGGKVTFKNVAPPGHGAIVRIVLPRAKIEATALHATHPGRLASSV